MQRRHLFVRNIHASSLLETFFVAGVTALLAIRFYLAATGYPKIGGAGLHIAHMLWGGLFMLLAIVLLLSFLGRRVQLTGALLGGIGFGTFIDELGKFITNDNNYFFQPTIALIYIIFILLLLVFRVLERHTYISEQARLANALDLFKEGILHTMCEKDKAEALLLLHAKRTQDRRAQLLAEAIESIPVAPSEKPGIAERIGTAARNFYLRLIQTPHFATIVILLFTGYALFLTLLLLLDLMNGAANVLGNFKANLVPLSVLISSVVSDIMILVGAISLCHSPLRAYLWFKRAILVSIFLTQVFMFYSQQLRALSELAVSLVMLFVLNYLLHHKRYDLRHEAIQREMAGAVQHEM